MRPAHRLFSFQGVFKDGGSAVETWQFGIRMRPRDPAGDTNTMDALAAATAWSDNLRSIWGTGLALTKVTVAEVLANGHWATDSNGAFVKGEWTGDWEGNSGQNLPFMPRQTALVVTLTTARAGASGKGRIFLPLHRDSLDGQGRISTGRRDEICTKAAAFISELNEGGSREVVVASGKGFLTTVTGVRVGRVPDTQRSRRRDLLEDYSACPVTVNPL